MISTFRELISPLSESEFSDLLRNRTLTFRPSSGENRYLELLSWDTLRGLIESNVVPTDKFRITVKTNTVPPIFYVVQGKVVAARLAQLMGQGASLITNPVEKYVPALKTLCADIAMQTGESSRADVIVSTGSSGALPLHFDTFDIIVLQMEGTKRWRLYGPPVIDPIKGMPKQTPPQTEPLFDKILQPGDFLFMPGGYWHHCDNQSELSLHVAIMIQAPTGWHAMKALVPQLLAEDIFRVPLTRFTGAAEKSGMKQW